MRSLKSFLHTFCSSRSSSDQRTISMPSSRSSGMTWSLKTRAWRCISSRLPSQSSSSCSRGSRPLAARTATPAAIRRLSPATRTMKNSSRLLAKMARKRVRSSSGSAGSSASSRTRWLKCSHDSSRSRNRSWNFSTAAISSASGTYGGSTSNVSGGCPNGSVVGPSSTDVPTLVGRDVVSDMCLSVSPDRERRVPPVHDVSRRAPARPPRGLPRRRPPPRRCSRRRPGRAR